MHCSNHMTDVTALKCFTGDALSKCLLLRHPLKLILSEVRHSSKAHC